ncbi:hypothetical protein UW163_21220 (plasmid) [Ralstonia solanacearum]|nr:hypothetical protein UW163_21220 [Ralstonia solanacearum]AMP76078.1 hypothetical protein RALBFv3_17895 [Ralstonia solanacearum]EUJ12679.1 hypothetical protein RSP673_19800 [Ralstonia solanacearum P673]OAI67859.1 hypothetical protein RSP797_20515 [Ralstonia solanacearum]
MDASVAWPKADDVAMRIHLSAACSIDGYMDDASDARLVLSGPSILEGSIHFRGKPPEMHEKYDHPIARTTRGRWAAPGV